MNDEKVRTLKAAKEVLFQGTIKTYAPISSNIFCITVYKCIGILNANNLHETNTVPSSLTWSSYGVYIHVTC